ncbi:MAG: hypothetical protein Kow0074_03990 [Candidatus Zixiibacteriota bacterium]
MVSGVAIAAGGFVWPRVWGWRVFRTLHLIGLMGTASVPLWSREGLCPLTLLEWELGNAAGGAPRSFIIRLLSEILYVDVSPVTLSIVTGLGAVFTLVMYWARPPWRIHAR